MYVHEYISTYKVHVYLIRTTGTDRSSSKEPKYAGMRTLLLAPLSSVLCPLYSVP